MGSRSYNFREVFEFPKVRESKSVIIDGDSLTFIAAYTGKDEMGNKNPEYTEEDYPVAEGILTDLYLKILNKIEEHYDVVEIVLCLKGDNNPRTKWFPDYKKHRGTPLPIIEHLRKYLITNHKGIEAPIGEADDMVATLSRKVENCIICGTDKDLHQLPGIHYNYRKDDWLLITEKEAIFNFYKQWLLGDAGDGINFSKGIGEKYVMKNMNPGMTEFELLLEVWRGYKKANKDRITAKNNMKLAYKLLKLWDLEELEKLRD